MTDNRGSRMGRVAVVGRFPPPNDGQTILTRGLADMLDPEAVVRTKLVDNELRLPEAVLRINTEPTGSSVAEVAARSPARFIHFVRLRFRIKTELARFRPDGILWPAVSPGTAGHFRDVLLSLPSFPRGPRVYAVIHRGNFHELFTSALTGPTGRRMVDRVHGFVFNSEGLAERCAPWIPAEKRYVIPNAIESDMLVDPQELEEKRAEHRRRADLRVLYLSNMIPSKGYFDVARAIALIEDDRVHADFVGAWTSQSDRTELEEFVERRLLQHRIRIHGAVRDRERIRRYLLDADVLVLPTYYPNEAQPLVVVEALNAGVPVIATPHCSIPEMIGEGRSGLFVSPRAPGDIASALARLRDDDVWLRLSQGARMRFEAQFSARVVLRSWLELLRTNS